MLWCGGRPSYAILICLKCRYNVLDCPFHKDTAYESKTLPLGILGKYLGQGAEYEPVDEMNYSVRDRSNAQGHKKLTGALQLPIQALRSSVPMLEGLPSAG